MQKSYCIFSANYLPNVGGVERYTYYLAKKLIERGNHVTVVTSNVFSLPAHEVSEEGIEIYRLPCINLLNGRFPVLKPWGLFRKLHKELKAKPFDFFIVNTRFYVHSLYGVWLAHKKKTKGIVLEHGSAHLTIASGFWDTVGQAYEHLVTSRIKHYCKDFYGVSKTCVKWLAHFGIQAKGVLYNAVDLNEIDQLLKNKKRNFHQEYQIPPGQRVVTYTGRLVEEKGILSIVKAAEQLKNQNIHIFFAGDGPLYDTVKALDPKRFTALGRLTFEDVISLLEESDIFCLPSLSEGFCTSYLEAVACKVFCVCSLVGGIDEILTDASYGIALEGIGEQAVLTGLKQALDRTDWVQAAENAYSKLLDTGVTWDATVSKIINICESGGNL